MRAMTPVASFAAASALVAISACTAEPGAAPAGTSVGSSRGSAVVPTPSSGPPATVPGRFRATTGPDGSVGLDTGAMQVSFHDGTGPLALGVVVDRQLVLMSTGGLYVVRNGAVVTTERSTFERSRSEGDDIGPKATISVGLTDGSTGTVEIEATTARTVHVTFTPTDPATVTEWGMKLALQPGEAIYGLTERIVDDLGASELIPAEVGSLDRRGEVVTMYTIPTISGYAPFHQSSVGYGLLVDGTMPGVYDIGRADPDELDLRFELSPREAAGGFHVFAGPTHGEILDGYTALTGRPVRPPSSVFSAWRGRDEYRTGATAMWHGIEINADVARDLQAYEDNGLPAGVFHFDRPWGTGPAGYGELRFDPERFPNVEAMLAEMRRSGWTLMVWTSPWAIGVLGDEARAKGFIVPASDRALDLTDPEARAWIEDKLVTFLTSPEGRHIDGFFMDRGEEGDVPSRPTDVYADGRTGREIHNAYPVLFQQVWSAAMERARPDGSGFLIGRGAYTGSQAYVMRWGGDTHSREGILLPEVPQTTPSTDKGLRSVLISIQRAAFLATAYWGSDIGGYSNWIDRDLYARWIEVGAASPLMRFHGKGPAPWDVNPDGSMDAELLAVYQRYVDLHTRLRPYLDGLADEASTTGMTLVRPLVFTWPAEAGARDRWDEWTLGPDLLVAPVWRSGDRSRSIWFPAGRWVSWWDPTVVVEGPVEQTVDVPLDVLPLYAREGSSVLSLR